MMDGDSNSMELRDVVADPLRDLQHRVTKMAAPYEAGGHSYTCPLTGCTWQLPVPLMRLQWSPSGTSVSVSGVLREQVEQALGAHLDWHAEQAETGAVDVPPVWLLPEDLDPDATVGVDPATGIPLEQSGVNVRLAP